MSERQVQFELEWRNVASRSPVLVYWHNFTIGIWFSSLVIESLVKLGRELLVLNINQLNQVGIE